MSISGPRMDQEPDRDEPLPEPTREEQEGDAWEYWYQRAHKLEAAIHKLLRASEDEWNATIADNNLKTVETMEAKLKSYANMATARADARIAIND